MGRRGESQRGVERRDVDRQAQAPMPPKASAEVRAEGSRPRSQEGCPAEQYQHEQTGQEEPRTAGPDRRPARDNELRAGIVAAPEKNSKDQAHRDAQVTVAGFGRHTRAALERKTLVHASGKMLTRENTRLGFLA